VKAPINQATADVVIDALLAKRGMVLMSKDHPLGVGIGIVFDGLRLARVNVPSGEEFRRRFFTGIWPFVMCPEGWRSALDPRAQLSVIAHEATHGDQVLANILKAGQYLIHAEVRANWEAEAFSTNDEIDFALDGVLPPARAELDHPVRYGYALTAGDEELVRGLREQRLTGVQYGVIQTPAGREAIAKIHAMQPDALDPRAVALIRANSPGVIA
jgi:hypothetical protein